MRNPNPLLILIGLLSLVSSGCSYRPALALPAVELPVLEATGQAAPADDWWLRYGSADLPRLLADMLDNNNDVAVARQRIRQARALLGQQQATNSPDLSMQLSSRHSRRLETGTSEQSSNLAIAVGYDVDVWGARDASAFVAEVGVKIQHLQHRSLVLQLQSSLVKGYILMLTLRERLAIAQQNLAAAQSLYDLIQQRFDAGSVSGIELAQQRNTVLAARSRLLELERALNNSGQALAVVLGRGSLQVPDLATEFQALTVPLIQPVQPAELLQRRPDIELAKAQWRVAEAEHYAQQQQRWPTLSLSGGVSLAEVLRGGQDWVGALAGSLAGPLWDAGRIRQQIVVAEAELSVAEIAYRQTVLLAMQDVIVSLTAFTYQQDVSRLRQQELDNARQLYQLAEWRYDAGDTDFINLLSAQRAWFTARDSAVQASSDSLLASVDVFRALGQAPVALDASLREPY